MTAQVTTSVAPVYAPATVDRVAARHFLWLLFAVNLLNYVDRASVTGLLEVIRVDFRASDAQMGIVGAAFLMTYALLPPVFGWLGDRHARKTIIAWSASFWCVATAIAGLTRNVAQLAATRAAVGIGEASYMANSPGLIADLYPEKRRGRALSFFFTAAPMGSAIGVAIAGFLAGILGWRSACFLVGLPGLLLVVLLARMHEPPRGATDTAAAGPPRALRSTLAYLVRNRVYLLLTAAFAGSVFAQNAVEFWLPTVLQREKALAIVQANAAYGAMVLCGGLAGPLLGGVLGDLAVRRTARGYFYIVAMSAVLMAVPLALIAVAHRPVPLFSAVLVEALFGNMSWGLVFAVVVTIVAAELRSTATAVLVTMVHLLGDVISQPLVGRVSTSIETGRAPALAHMLSSFGVDAVGHHLSLALVMVTMPACLLSSLLYLAAARHVPRTAPGNTLPTA